MFLKNRIAADLRFNLAPRPPVSDDSALAAQLDGTPL
jgi:hypothetical protein